MTKTPTNTVPRRATLRIVPFVLLVLFLAISATAGPIKGAHVGFMSPVATRLDGTTTNITDNVVIGFPMGVTLARSGRVAFDFEVVPAFDPSPFDGEFTLHPGLIVGVSDGFAAGVRAAYEVDSKTFGFTPLLNRSFAYGEGDNRYFVEFIFPVRFVDVTPSISRTSVGFGVHFGLGF